MSGRRRVAGIIERDGTVLMVRERVRLPDGTHRGAEYWTLPGGGVEEGESERAAVEREVWEETGLVVLSATEVARLPMPSGPTTVFRVVVADGTERLGADDLDCDCPRMVGLDWITLAAVPDGGSPVPVLLYSM